MHIPAFELSRQPRLVFGSGAINKLPALASQYGKRALLVTGAKSFRESAHYHALENALRELHMQPLVFTVSGEPSPQLVDDAARELRTSDIDVVIGVGGGSVLDTAKAVAGLLRVPNSVMDFLEGVGPELPYNGPSVPFIAVPTTAGTGSEVTKNAVLSVQGKNGFKKSFRHEMLLPEYAVLDPDLLATCPQAQIAANGMDALTQLLESYVSTRANPYTDALAMSGIGMVREGMFIWHDNTSRADEGRNMMLYAAYLSGITLAQAGLGAVHGLAAPLGAYFPIPHGVACGTLVAACTEINIRALKQRAPNDPALAKYAIAGKVLMRDMNMSNQAGLDALLKLLKDWTHRLQLPRLSTYGMVADDIPRVVQNSRGNSMKTNPIVLDNAELVEILLMRL